MASTIDPNIAQSLIKDATVSQGYYSVSRGTLLSRDAYADRETLDNQSSPPQKEGMANASSIKILRHGRHRFRRWWNRIYLREKYKENDNPGCNATPDTDEHAGTSAIATAGTTAGIDARDLDLSAKLSSRNDGYERGTVKRTKLDSLSSDTCSDTQIDEPSVSLEELGSFRYRNSKRFNTLKDWINKTLRRTRNSTFSSRYQQEMVISNFDFDSDQVINGKLPQSNGNNNTATTKYKPKSGASTAAMTSEGETEHERTSTPLTGSASEPSNDQVTCLDTAADDEFVVDAEQETKEKRLRMLMLESLRLAGKHRTNVASFNSIGHIGDVAIKDDDRDDNDMYIKLKDIGLSPTNEFYRELYAICNI